MARRRARSVSLSKPLSRLLIVAALGIVGVWAKSQGWLPNGPIAPRPFPSSAVDADGMTIVERVVDGDTLVIEGGERVRLIGVDTPETKHPNKPPQPFGLEAFAFTRRMAEGKQVQLRFDPREAKDRYGRTLAYVYVDGELLNERIIREGLARALLNYPFSPDMKALFRNAEASAKAARRGVWSLPARPTDIGQRVSDKKAG